MSRIPEQLRAHQILLIIEDLSANELRELEYVADSPWNFTGSILGHDKFIKHDLIERRWSGATALFGLSKCAITLHGLAVLRYNKHGWLPNEVRND